METIDPKVKIGNMIQSKILKNEIYILGLIILSLVLSSMEMPYAGLFATVVLTSISVIYFLSAFSIPENQELTAIDIFLHKLVAIGSAVAIIGILFIAQNWPNGKMMLTVGFLTLAICFTAMIYLKIKRPENQFFNKIILLRITLLLVASIGLLYMGK